MNNFLRAQSRHFSVNAIKSRVRPGIGVLCSLVAFVALLSPLHSFAQIGFAGAVILPNTASPQLVCSGGTATVTLTPSTCNPGPGAFNWSANYALDSSLDGGGTWFVVTTGTINAASPNVNYVSPPLMAPTACYDITYRFRLTSIVNQCSGGSTFTSLNGTVRVCPAPSAISGPGTVCVGQTISVATTSTGGTWSINPFGIATIDAAGTVTGLPPGGTALISYTLAGGCAATHPVTVVPTPAAITGPTSICVGSAATYSLSAAPFTGTWTSSNPTAGTINATTGAFSALGAGVTNIVNTNAAGCFSTLSVTVNSMPVDHPVTGGGNYCAGGVGLPVGLTGSESGTSYQLYNGAALVGAPVAGTGSAFSFGTFTAAGTYTVMATRAAICSVAMSGSAVITIDPLPDPITGPSSLCMGTTAVYSSTTGGGTWMSSDTSVAMIDTFSGLLSADTAGFTTLTYTLPTGCFVTYNVTVNVTPTAITGPGIMCTGTTATFTAAPTGGNWLSSSPGPGGVASVGLTTGVVSANNVGTANITYVLPGGCQATRTITVQATPAPIMGSTFTVCGGSSITLTSATPGGFWLTSDATRAIVGGGIVTGGLSPGTVIISYELPGGCRDTAIVTVLPAPTPIAGPSIVCVGNTITLTNSTPGGTWSSSHPANASIVSTTGVVTGLTVGTTATISYTTSGACFATHVVSVEPVPAPITGLLVICEGQSTTLATTSSGGTWESSNPAVGSIDPATGVLDGLAPGTTIVGYAFATGCRSNAVVTVNPLPAPISGPLQVCQGGCVMLTNATAGGTWMSSVPPTADIGSTSGVVCGFFPGTVNITYMLPTGCLVDTLFTVNPNPLPIDGTAVVCVGSITTLSNASPGGPGTWSSSNPPVAVINSVTGVVTGVMAGTSTITFRLPTGCFITQVVTVNPLPAAITGYARTCVGTCTSLASTTPGGTWSSLDVAVATIGTGGSLCGVSPGTAIISYTLPTGCATLVIATVNTVLPPPTGILDICVGGTTTLSHDTAGGTWTSSDTITAKVFLGTGVVTGFTAGTANITYTTPWGCTAFATVTVHPVPPATTGILYMCEGNSTTLSNLYPGGSWSSSHPLIASVGTSGVVNGVAAGTATISYILPSPAGCAATVTVTVYPLPAILGSVLVCPDIAAPLTGVPAGGLWASGSPGIATIGSLSGVVMGVSTGTSVITYTLATTCRSTAIVTVQPLPAPITGPSQVCVGSTITLLNFTTGGGTWSSSHPAIGSIDMTTGVVTGVSAGTTRITFTAAATGCIITTLITVNPLPGAISGLSEVCVGATITLSSSPAGGTWSSTGTFATIGSSSGVVTGIADGVEFITYTLPTGCVANFTVTVHPLPSPISGTLILCHTYTTLLSSATPGGIWSISPTSVATIDASGLVTAVSPGTATVTYTLPTTGCFVTAVVTVNPLPGPITGLLNICVNDTTSLFNSVPGGTWSTDNIFIAVMVGTTNVVASVSAGTVTLTYTLPTGCYTTAVLTINPIPPPITGPYQLCVTFSDTLFNVTTGGSWSSSNPAIANIGSADGIVTGVAPGVAFITYTLPSSCSRVIQFTVNPSPTPITGSLSICKYDTTILSSTPPGGTWSSSNPTDAFIFMPTGQMIGLDTGTAVITYMLSTGCYRTANVIVNPVPSASGITGSRVVCVGASSLLSHSDYSPLGTWTSSNPAIASVGLVSGVLTGVGTIGSAPTTATITYTLPTGCDTFITVTVNPLPAAITGPGEVCQGDNITLSSATPGGVWSSGTPGIGSIDPSTGVFTGVAGYGITVVTYSITATGCSISRIITVNPLPGAIVGVTDICLGGDTILSSTPGGGGWSSFDPSIVSVTAITSDFDSARITGLTVGTTFITYTLPTGCYRTVVVEVHPLPAAITGPNNVCVLDSITLTSSPVAPAGTWSSSNPAIGSIDPFTGKLYGISAGVVTVTYTLGFDCKEVFTVTVNPLPDPIGGPDNVCETYTITATNATTGGVWSISDTTIATIDTATGLITGVLQGTVTIFYTLPTGCFVARVITVNPLPVITVNHPTVICKYASITLTATGAGTGGTYSWSPSTGLSTTSGPVVDANPTVTTTYTVTGTTQFGCSDTVHVTVWIDSLLNDISVTGKDKICRGDCTVLIANGREGTFFSWRPAPGLSCTICDTTTACPLNTTTYTMLAIDSLGCRDSLNFTVTVMPLPVMTVLPNPVIVCNGSTTQVTVTDANATSTEVTRFAWFPNAFISCDTCPNPILSNTTNLVYRVTGITPFGCFDSLRVPVTVLDSAFNSINKDTVICIGGSAQLNIISTNPDGARSDYFWINTYEINNRYIPNPIVRPAVTTTYSVIVTPNICWPDTLYTTVVVVPYPEISISPASASLENVAFGSSIPLSATITNEMVISSYAWSPPGTLSCINCYNTVATPSVTTTYTFTATSSYGCQSFATVTIRLGCDPEQIFIANTFTPNGDGMNDRFFVQGKGISTVTKFLIYNRWGELVYERYNIPPNDASYGWDGQFKGVVLPPDVFYYFVEAKCNLDGAEFKYKGDVSIVR